jgi:molecular chaperone HscC
VTLDVDEHMLELASAPLLKRLRAPIERALRDASLRGGQLDDVVLAGGATRMPMIRRLVTTMFGRFPAIDFNPDEVVALGAAVQAGLKATDAALKEVVMTDVSPYSLGVEISKRLSETIAAPGHFDPIIERNTPVPVSRVKTYLPVSRMQKFVDLDIFQGEARMVKDKCTSAACGSTCRAVRSRTPASTCASPTTSTACCRSRPRCARRRRPHAW